MKCFQKIMGQGMKGLVTHKTEHDGEAGTGTNRKESHTKAKGTCTILCCEGEGKVFTIIQTDIRTLNQISIRKGKGCCFIRKITSTRCSIMMSNDGALGYSGKGWKRWGGRWKDTHSGLFFEFNNHKMIK